MCMRVLVSYLLFVVSVVCFMYADTGISAVRLLVERAC